MWQLKRNSKSGIFFGDENIPLLFFRFSDFCFNCVKYTKIIVRNIKIW